jgi:hypothetical protein
VAKRASLIAQIISDRLFQSNAIRVLPEAVDSILILRDSILAEEDGPKGKTTRFKEKEWNPMLGHHTEV